MSIISKILLAFVAGFLLFMAPQARAEGVSATEIYSCTNAWATTWAQGHGKTVADAMRYARRIQTTPTTTLSIDGKDWVFGPNSEGATVWSTCEASLTTAREQRTASTAPTPSVVARTHGGLTFDQMAEQSDRLIRQNTDLNRRLAAKDSPLPELLAGFLLCLVLLTIVGGVVYQTRIEKIVWVKRRPYTIVGTHGEVTPRQAPGPDLGFDDPTRRN